MHSPTDAECKYFDNCALIKREISLYPTEQDRQQRDAHWRHEKHPIATAQHAVVDEGHAPDLVTPLLLQPALRIAEGDAEVEDGAGLRIALRVRREGRPARQPAGGSSQVVQAAGLE